MRRDQASGLRCQGGGRFSLCLGIALVLFSDGPPARAATTNAPAPQVDTPSEVPGAGLDWFSGRSNLAERCVLQVGSFADSETRFISATHPVTSPALAELLPQYAFHHVETTRDGLHYSGTFTLGLATNAAPIVLDTDEICAQLLSSCHRRVRTQDIALLLVYAFADLRAYKRQLRPPRPGIELPRMAQLPGTIPATEWEMVSRQEDGLWIFEMVFVTSDGASPWVYKRYRVSVSGEGEVRARELKEVLRLGAFY